MMERLRAVFIGAHPDDIERNAGGAVAMLAGAGWEVQMVSLTSGQMGTYGDPETRKKEFEASVSTLGVTGVIMGMADTKIMNDELSCLAVAGYVRHFRPHVVFAPYLERGQGCLYGNGAHRDHYITGQLVTSALLLANITKAVPGVAPWRTEIFCYYLLPVGIVPDFFIPVSERAMQLALKAIDQYVSQQGLYRGHGTLGEYLISQRMLHTRMGVRLPEGFTLAEGFRLGTSFVAGSRVAIALLSVGQM